jgi:hypothetical protein
MRKWAAPLMGIGLFVAVVGATLAFALDKPDVGAFDVEAFGGIILAAGAIMLAAGAISAVATAGAGNGSGTGTAVDPSNLKAIVGLVAVVAGVAAVTALTVITVTILGKDDSRVAITSSAFGVISAVVSAYLGIKITAEAAGKNSEEVKAETRKAAVATQKAEEAQAERDKVISTAADEFVPESKKADFKLTLAEKGVAPTPAAEEPKPVKEDEGGS